MHEEPREQGIEILPQYLSDSGIFLGGGKLGFPPSLFSSLIIISWAPEAARDAQMQAHHAPTP